MSRPWFCCSNNSNHLMWLLFNPDHVSRATISSVEDLESPSQHAAPGLNVLHITQTKLHTCGHFGSKGPHDICAITYGYTAVKSREDIVCYGDHESTWKHAKSRGLHVVVHGCVVKNYWSDTRLLHAPSHQAVDVVRRRAEWSQQDSSHFFTVNVYVCRLKLTNQQTPLLVPSPKYSTEERTLRYFWHDETPWPHTRSARKKRLWLWHGANILAWVYTPTPVHGVCTRH